MLRSCWRYDPHQRADIESLREQLCHKPTLIQPCLDAPRSAVDPPDDMEDHLHDIRYKRTLSEHSQLKNLEQGAGQGGGGTTGVSSGGRPLQTSPTALSIASDPLSHEEVMMPSHEMDWTSGGDRSPGITPDITDNNTPPPLPPLPPVTSSTSLKDLVVKIPNSNNHMQRPSCNYVIRAPRDGGGSGGNRPLSAGDKGANLPPLPKINQNRTENNKGGKTMRTITNPMDTFMFITGTTDCEPNGYSAGAACLTNGRLKINDEDGKVSIQMREQTVVDRDDRLHELMNMKESVA